MTSTDATKADSHFFMTRLWQIFFLTLQINVYFGECFVLTQTSNHRWLLLCRLIIQTSLRVHCGSCKLVQCWSVQLGGLQLFTNAMWGILGFWKNTVKMLMLSLPCFKRTNTAKDTFLLGLLVSKSIFPNSFLSPLQERYCNISLNPICCLCLLLFMVW